VFANADVVIENWARFMALDAGSDPWKPTRDNINQALTAIYKYRHPDDADGLQKLIDKFKSNGSPAGGAAADVFHQAVDKKQQSLQLRL
jgi:hypothetical protein